jgi:ABC-type dipeptide/oligopeptide/nickel transport system ATPase component
MADAPLLRVDDLHVTYHTPTGLVQAVRGVSFELGREKLGIVGESGSGKSQTGRAILGLTAPGGEVRARRLEFEAQYLKALLDKHGDNITRSAKAAGLTRYHLRELAKRYGLRDED